MELGNMENLDTYAREVGVTIVINISVIEGIICKWLWLLTMY